MLLLVCLSIVLILASLFIDLLVVELWFVESVVVKLWVVQVLVIELLTSMLSTPLLTLSIS